MKDFIPFFIASLVISALFLLVLIDTKEETEFHAHAKYKQDSIMQEKTIDSLKLLLKFRENENNNRIRK